MSLTDPAYLELEHLWRPGGWTSPAWLEVDEDGRIAAVHDARPADWSSDARRIAGWTLPGLGNLHGHSFQRLLAGHAEHGAPGHEDDSFWTWREAMYGVAGSIGPELLEAAAAMLYVELLEAGHTSHGEFHYLHRTPEGSDYADRTELSQRLIAAAERTGIGLTLLPVLYLHAGPGRPLAAAQRRFGHRDVADYLGLVEALVPHMARDPRRVLGLAPHSLRAVAPVELGELLLARERLVPHAPVHLHVAEQRRELEECVEAYGRRPLRLLLDDHAVDERWCLVHATWADEDELAEVARRRAIVGLCPTTEANLGDGLFPLPAFLAQGGRFGLGSDSHVSVSTPEELRLLEYGQRLVTGRRNLCAPTGSVGRRLFDAAVEGGAQALAQGPVHLGPGERADLVVLDGDHPRLLGHGSDTLLDAWIFSSAGGTPIREDWVAGRRVVDGGRHVDRERVRAEFERALR
ncbi:MAG: formimidoylglutamate deiminase [Planctomycetota bacterium]